MTLKSIPPESLYNLLRQGAMPDIIDVRTSAEFSELHIDGAQLFPLTSLRPDQVMASRQGRHEETLYVVCRTGSRAEVACRKFYDAGFHNVVSVGGGTVAWEAAGLPVVRAKSQVPSLERQVRIGAGLLVMTGVILGTVVHPIFYALSGFVGAGLTYAGVTDWCGMALLLAKMPWNQASGSSKRGAAIRCSRSD